MCPPKTPKIDNKLPDPLPAAEAPPEPPIKVNEEDTLTKRMGRNALRIDLAAGNTSLGRSGLNI